VKQERREFRDKRNVDQLTPREQQIWVLYQEGKQPKEIGEVLGITNTSVTRNLVTIREKVALNG
jgi:DNA-binding NarL/FixJ family response regulator